MFLRIQIVSTLRSSDFARERLWRVRTRVVLRMRTATVLIFVAMSACVRTLLLTELRVQTLWHRCRILMRRWCVTCVRSRLRMTYSSWWRHSCLTRWSTWCSSRSWRWHASLWEMRLLLNDTRCLTWGSCLWHARDWTRSDRMCRIITVRRKRRVATCSRVPRVELKVWLTRAGRLRNVTERLRAVNWVRSKRIATSDSAVRRRVIYTAVLRMWLSRPPCTNRVVAVWHVCGWDDGLVGFGRYLWHEWVLRDACERRSACGWLRRLMLYKATLLRLSLVSCERDGGGLRLMWFGVGIAR